MVIKIKQDFFLTNCDLILNTNYEEILDKLSEAWNAFANDTELVKSICYRSWAKHHEM